MQVRPNQPMPGTPNHPLPEMPLVRELQGLLYQRYYTRSEEHEPAAPFVPDPSFAPRLAASNRTQARWEGGWIVYTIGPNGQVWVQKGDRQRSAVAGEFATSGVPGMPVYVGATVSVFSPRESFTAQQGFYYVYGETLSDVWDEHALVRFYFHSNSESAPLLVEYLTSTLNRFFVPFRMKTLIEPSMYQRSDPTVLYVAKRWYNITARIVQDLPRDISSSLRKSVPLFSRYFQDGIGIAEDPNTGESFGMHRCRMVAEGIVDAWIASDQSVEGRLAAIAARFASNRCYFDAPHVGAGSAEFATIPAKVEFAYA